MTSSGLLNRKSLAHTEGRSSASSYVAKLGAQTIALFNRRAASRPVSGETSIRLPPRDGITLLRAATCLSIVVVHLQPCGTGAWPDFLPLQLTPSWLITHARLGFESFFVLAGYFLAHSFRPKPSQTPSVWGFFKRRVVRLLLPYWLILSASCLATVLYAIRHHQALTWSPPGFWRQMLLMHNLDVAGLVAPQLWFMAPLIQFYLGWGVIFWLITKARRGIQGADDPHATSKAMMPVMAVIFCVSVLTDSYRGGVDFTLATNAHYLALGCLCYWYTNERVHSGWLLCALGMEVANGCVINQSRPLATVVSALLLVHCAGRTFSAGPKLAWPMRIGRCSYSIYLTHMFVGWRSMAVFGALTGHQTGILAMPAVTSMAGVLGCLLTGGLYHHFVEQPCARWAGKIKYRHPAPSPPGLPVTATERHAQLQPDPVA